VPGAARRHKNRQMKIIRIRHICILIAFGLLLTGCLNTEGNLEIKGTVIDDFTKMQIPGRDIIVQGLVQNDRGFISIDAGQFSTDNSGCFTYTLRKVKDADYYNFCFVGDSDYAYVNRYLGLFELEQNAKFLSFPISKLTDLTIKIYKENKNPVVDTLSVTWESNGVSCWSLYPYKIDNYGKAKNYLGLTTWIGGDVISSIKTRVFADKRTKLYRDLIRNGKRMENTDTITCKRDIANVVYIKY
jgi:hypothetical protein